MNPLLYLLFTLSAMVYASVGFGGGSAYLAWFVLFGVSSAIAAPMALICNIIVVAGGTVRFVREGHFRWRLFLPFAAGSFPLAFAGGAWLPPLALVKMVTALSLGASALAILFAPRAQNGRAVDTIPLWQLWLAGLPAGAILGWLAGVVGIGGGIFLVPVLYLLRWGEPRQIAAVSSVFILVNSISGLAGHSIRSDTIHGLLPYLGLTLAVLAGGQLGSAIGARRLHPVWIRRVTALILLWAAVRMGANVIGRG